MKNLLTAFLFGSLIACSSHRSPLKNEQLENAIYGKKDDFNACAKKSKAGTDGIVLAHFTIMPAGIVDEAKVKNTTLNQAEVENCIITTLKMVEFPHFKANGEVEVDYPFVVRSNQILFIRDK